MDKKANILIFSIILLIALFLRFLRISDLPPSLNWDEVSIGYNAYSILRTGRDEWGNFLPLSFRAFGDYKLPLLIYLDVPFVAILGLNEIAVRLPSVVAGVGIVVLTFLILKELTKRFYLALLGMLLSATLPWLLIFSRIALEANLALFLTLLSFYFLLLSFPKKPFILLSSFFLGLSIFTYNSSRVLILPFLMLAGVSIWNELDKKKGGLVAFFILLFFMAVAFYQAFGTDSKARYRWTTLLDEGATLTINRLRQDSNLPPQLSPLIYNKASFFLTEFTKNYFSHFNPRFLFLEGGSNYQFSVPGSGLLYWTMLPFILFGIYQIFLQKKVWQIFILGWLLIAPLPAAITRDAPHALRSLFLIPPFIFITVLGLEFAFKFLDRKISLLVSSLFILLSAVSFYLFWQNYSLTYVKNYSWSWQYGYKQAIDFIKINQEKYDRIVFTKKYGEPHIFVLFYLGYDPGNFQSDKNLVRYKRSDWFWVDRFGKFEFVDDGEIKDKILGMKNTLLLTSPDNYPANSQILDTINFLDGKKAFEIVVLR